MKVLKDIRLELFAQPRILKDHELLALIISTSDQKGSSLEVASRLLKKAGEFEALLDATRDPSFLNLYDVAQIPGGRIIALSEIVRRLEKVDPAGGRTQSLALAYLSMAAETLEALAEQSDPTADQVQQAASLLRQWHVFAQKLL